MRDVQVGMARQLLHDVSSRAHVKKARDEGVPQGVSTLALNPKPVTRPLQGRVQPTVAPRRARRC